MMKRLLTPLLAALVAGCSLVPKYERPEAPVAPGWPEAAATAGANAPDLPWRDFLADERLRALVDLALANNRDLRIATLNVEQARAAAGIAAADRWPTVNAVVQGERTNTGTNGSIESTWLAGLSVSAFELDLFGRVRALSQAAAARYLASAEGRRAAEVALVAQVASQDLALRADDDLVALTRATVESREEGLRLAHVRFDAGAAAETELRSAESLLAAARASLAALERQRSQDRNALVLLLGQPLPEGLPAGTPLAKLALADLPAGLPSEVLLQRPDVRAAEQTLVAANADIGAARAAFFPHVSLTASIGTGAPKLSDLFKNTVWDFVPQLVQPIFDAGRNSANLDSAKAARGIAVAEYEKAIQTAFREVADALAGRATLGDQLAATQAQAAAETRRAELAELLYQGGAASLLDRLDAERSALAARQAEVQLQAAQVQNAVLLYRVLGGGAAGMR